MQAPIFPDTRTTITHKSLDVREPGVISQAAVGMGYGRWHACSLGPFRHPARHMRAGSATHHSKCFLSSCVGDLVPRWGPNPRGDL